jgi:uncharacterized protein (DUF983 family)
MLAAKELAPLAAALTDACPRCGEGRLFEGAVRFAGHCTGCHAQEGRVAS